MKDKKIIKPCGCVYTPVATGTRLAGFSIRYCDTHNPYKPVEKHNPYQNQSK